MSNKPTAMTPAPDGYGDWLAEMEGRIHRAQQSATLAVNRELISLYWQIGTDILARQAAQGWGAKVIERLAHDLRKAFPEMKGFSRTNLLYMRSFAEAWSDQQIVQHAVGQLPWGHNLVLLSKLKTTEERLAYAQKTLEHGWSRNVLVMQIETGLLERQGAALTNFEQQLPKAQSDLDLLFYHLKLRCYIVIELKSGDFKPEHLGQLGFYLTAVDRKIKAPEDQSTIGLLLCKSKNKVVAEYALGSKSQPIGIAEYQLKDALPKIMETNLPSIEQIEEELQGGQI